MNLSSNSFVDIKKPILIIGSGIIGLSLAEFLSRDPSQRVVIMSNEHPLAGSYAAAANLSTKGQLVARDFHFRQKLLSKQKYASWLLSLLKETGIDCSLEQLFQEGVGWDTFESSTDCQTHLKRVLHGECASSESIVQKNSHCIEYQKEAWVHAEGLLSLLKSVLQKRKVFFEKIDFQPSFLDSLLKDFHVVFCTGAWTKGLLTDCGIDVPSLSKVKENITIGSTWHGQGLFQRDDSSLAVVHEFIAKGKTAKVALSGAFGHQFISSSSLKLASVWQANTMSAELDRADDMLWDQSLSLAGEQIQKGANWSKTSGLRVRYGHQEFVVAEGFLSHKPCATSGRIFVCAGAHRSGFLFAPIVGDLFASLH